MLGIISSVNVLPTNAILMHMNMLATHVKVNNMTTEVYMTMGKQVKADSQSLTQCSIGRIEIYTLYPVWGVSNKW